MENSKPDNFDHVPPEMCFEIISYIDHVDDVKSLSLVSKKFHEIVGRSEAMDLIVLRLHADMDQQVRDQILESPRSYRNIQLHTFGKIRKLSTFSEIFEKFGANLTKLDIRDCLLTEIEFFDILKLFQNLTELSIHCTFIENMSGYVREKFKLDKLQIFEVESTSSDLLLSILLDVVPDTLEHIYYFENPFYDPVYPSFAEIVGMQKNLKSLDIALRNFDSFNTLFGSNYAVAFGNLKLESLSVISYHHCVGIDDNIFDFIKSQIEHLKSLALINLPVEDHLDVFKYMPNLEILSIENRSSNRSSFASGRNFRCPSMKRIILKFPFTDTIPNTYSNLIKRFANVNVTEIILKNEANFDLLKLIAKAFPNLKKIQIDKFDDDSFENQKAVFTKVQELVISGTADKEPIKMEFVFFALPKLKILKILGIVQIDSIMLFWILGNLPNLKHLEIENGTELRNLSNLSYIFKNLKFLCIANYDQSDMKKLRRRLGQFAKLKMFRITSKRSAAAYKYFSLSDEEDSENEEIEHSQED